MSKSIYKKICGIYKITSPSGRVNIGQSVDVERRWKEYKRLSCKGQPRLYNSFIAYGVEEHTFKIVEECCIESLNEKERYWQDEYDVLSKDGLNCKLTKTLDKSGVSSQETNERVRLSNIGNKRRFETGKLIQQYSLNNLLIKEGIVNIFIDEGFNGGEIYRRCRGKVRNDEYNGYFWKYKDDDLNFIFHPSIGFGKVVQQFALDGVFIKEATINVFIVEGFQHPNIYKCIIGERKTHKGFIWKYKYS